jgi:hypothetical protein
MDYNGGYMRKIPEKAISKLRKIPGIDSKWIVEYNKFIEDASGSKSNFFLYYYFIQGILK